MSDSRQPPPSRHTRRMRTRRLALGGLLASLALIAMTLAAMIPAMDLTMMSVTSLVVAVMCIEAGIRPAVLLVAAVSLLSLAYPGPVFTVYFLGFYGTYPLIKAMIERRFRTPVGTAIKVGLAGLVIVGAYFIFPPFRHQLMSIRLPDGLPDALSKPALLTVLSMLGFLILFVVYDMALTLLIGVYVRIRGKGRGPET